MNKPILESVAKALVIDDEGQVLVLTSSENKSRPWKSHNPDLPGGSVDPGENELEAVIREIHEETGILVGRTSITPVYSNTQFYSETNSSVSKHLFIVRVGANPDVKLSWEHESYEWIALKNLEDIELRSFYDEAIAYCFTNKILPAYSQI